MKWGSFLFCLLWSSIALTGVSRVEIPSHQKYVELYQGDQTQFLARAYDEWGQQTFNATFSWKITDRYGVETSLPGTIDQRGFLWTSYSYEGPFHVVVTELSSGLSDMATVELRPRYQDNFIYRIDIFPSQVSVPAGGSAYIGIHCFNRTGYEVQDYLLRYFVTDIWGRAADVLTVHKPGVIYARGFVPRGPYIVHFEDTRGPATAQVRVDIW